MVNNNSIPKKDSPRSFVNLEGKKFGNWSVSQLSRRTQSGIIWECICDCGRIGFISTSRLTKGKAKSCGCLPQSHGHARKGAKSPEYNTWIAMKQRCHNQKNKVYEYYGERGITVCEEWVHSFHSFYDYIGQKPSINHTIDRIDNNKGYEPGNVRWATRAEQTTNRRPKNHLTYNNETKSISEWENSLGFRPGTLSRRLRSGLCLDCAITIPLTSKGSMPHKCPHKVIGESDKVF